MRDDLTTRSQMYSTSMDARQRWREWGQWDVDYLVGGTHSDVSIENTNGDHSEGQDGGGKENGDGGERWNEEGHLLRNGKKWQRREVEILLGMRSWGDYLDLDMEKETREVEIRVELKGYMLK